MSVHTKVTLSILKLKWKKKNISLASKANPRGGGTFYISEYGDVRAS